MSFYFVLMSWRPRRNDIHTLHDAARANLLLWFFRTWCGHAGRISPCELAQTAKRYVDLAELRKHLKCTRCGNLGHAEIFPSEHPRRGERG
jgi:hypothetical protein